MSDNIDVDWIGLPVDARFAYDRIKYQPTGKRLTIGGWQASFLF